jgi:hypothetical protein
MTSLPRRCRSGTSAAAGPKANSEGIPQIDGLNSGEGRDDRYIRPLPTMMFRKFMQIKCSGAGGARTHDRRIMRTTARRSRGSTCTDTTEPCHRWPLLHCMHGWLGPRTGPRPPQRAPDVNYGTSPHAVRDPPEVGAISGLRAPRSRCVQIWSFCVRDSLSSPGRARRDDT